MFEYKGWLTLSFDSYEENFEKLQEQILILSEYIIKLNNDFQFAKIINCTENYTLSVVGVLNHENGVLKDVENLLNFVREILPASFGVIYYRDQDGLDYNSYIVIRLAKAKIERQSDYILSPCVPIIEE